MADTPFAEFITNRRRQLELTLGDVANGLGVSPITVSNWSSGDATPEQDQLEALAELLEVPADDLAGMAGIKLKAPEPAVNLMPTPPAPSDDEPEPSTEESTGPIAMLRTADEAEDVAAEGAGPEGDLAPDMTEAEEAPAAAAAAPQPTSPTQEPPPAETPEPAEPEPDEMDSELADLIEEAAAEERRDPTPAVVTQLPGPEETDRPARRRPSIRRRRPAAEQPVSALPLTYVEDPKQLTRYRIRWALTVIVLVIMFFILLWASRELLSALSEVRQAVTPGGIGS